MTPIYELSKDLLFFLRDKALMPTLETVHECQTLKKFILSQI